MTGRSILPSFGRRDETARGLAADRPAFRPLPPLPQIDDLDVCSTAVSLVSLAGMAEEQQR